MLRLIAPEPDSEEYKLIGRPTPVVFLTENVIAKFGEWSKRGVHFRYTPRLRRVHHDPRGSASDQPPVWGGVFTRFEDIDGNSFSLVGFDDVSQALEEQRRAIAEKLELERRAAQELEIARMVQARLFPNKGLAEKNAEIKDHIETQEFTSPRCLHLVECLTNAPISEVGSKCKRIIGKPSRYAGEPRIVEVCVHSEFAQKTLQCSVARFALINKV